MTCPGSQSVSPLDRPGFALLKRSFDVVASAAGLVVLSPLLGVLALGVRVSSPGPALFRQVRVGKDGRPFTMFKFRSMYLNSEQDTSWSGAHDARRTPFGRLIRKLSLDELPQLANVVRGEMSLVGPRPELPHFVAEFSERVPGYALKHRVRPGMTGWAQVNGYRGDTSIEQRVAHDLWYIGHWSPWLDARILLRTFFGGMVNRESLRARADGSAGGNATASRGEMQDRRGVS